MFIARHDVWFVRSLWAKTSKWARTKVENIQRSEIFVFLMEIGSTILNMSFRCWSFMYSLKLYKLIVFVSIFSKFISIVWHSYSHPLSSKTINGKSCSIECIHYEFWAETLFDNFRFKVLNASRHNSWIYRECRSWILNNCPWHIEFNHCAGNEQVQFSFDRKWFNCCCK